MNNKQDPNSNQPKKRRIPSKKNNFNHAIIFLGVLVFSLLLINTFSGKQQTTKVEFSDFRDKVETGEIVEVLLTNEAYLGYLERQYSLSGQQNENNFSLFSSSPNSREESAPFVYETVPVSDPAFIALMEEKNTVYSAELESQNYWLGFLLSWIVPILIIVFIMRIISSRMNNSGVMNFGQNKSKIVSEADIKTKFNDVAGCNEAKEELVEVVDFLQHPQKYSSIGGKIPKGVLLVGPPGTGKTLISRAIAGEANVTFFKMSGAEFVEMFVGVGAARVRDLFKQAREKAPCIIFIDELDAIGKSRTSSYSTNDEREQTLNQLLVEMDGFDSTTGVIVLAATNRPEVLDAALLRPGRFDRQVLIDKPDLLGREDILKIHSQTVKLSADIDLHKIAKATTGFVGADLANLINEAAILAVRHDRHAVIMQDLYEAIEKILVGLQKKNRLINPKEREIVAYHEVGHALIAAFTPDANPVQRISIIPRGLSALGYTMQTPTEDRFLMSEAELIGEMDVLLGGRAAELVIYSSITTGASNDIERVSKITHDMFTVYGFDPKFQNMALIEREKNFLGGSQYSKNYSPQTQDYLDNKIASLIKERYDHCVSLLTKHKQLLEDITHALLDTEDMAAEQFLEMINANELGKEELEKRKKANRAEILATEYGKKSGEDRNIAIKNRLKAESKKSSEKVESKVVTTPPLDQEEDIQSESHEKESDTKDI